MEQSLYERLLAGFEAHFAKRPPRASAAVVPWRVSEDGGLEVYWVRRSPQLKFMGGWWAFPGGGLSRKDPAIPVAGTPRGASEESYTAADPEGGGTEAGGAAPDLEPGLVACAVRELFEETGLLLSKHLDSAPLAEGEATRLEKARASSLEKGADFAAIAADQGWSLTAESLVFGGRWLTPPLAPMRFDNRFFLLEWSDDRDIQPTLSGGELAEGEWIAPAYALERWRRGEVLAAPPILHILKVLAEDGPVDGLPRLLDTRESNLGPLRRIEFRPGVTLLPLVTPTLPPATHTNAFLLGTHEAVLVDPASPIQGELERLRQALGAAREKGLEITAIWLTHHHRDHVGAVETMRRELDVPVCAHRLSFEPLAQQGIRVDRELEDQQRVELDGAPPFPIRVLHTPGHTRGHLSFYDETYGSLIIGDLVSTLSTIVIDPPEGDMDVYLDSLRRMAELAPATLFPAHGPAILGGAAKLEEFRRHRLEREAQVLATWESGIRQPADMVPAIYPDVPEAVYPIATRQVLAHLDRLRKLGKI